MAQAQKLQLRQAQHLVMTPQLQQSLKMLQLSTTELSAYVESELERNPLLERDEGQLEVQTNESTELKSDDTESVSTTSQDQGVDDGYDTVWQDRSDATEVRQKESSSPEELGYMSMSGGSHSDFNKDEWLEKQSDQQITLQDHLLDQVILDFNQSTKQHIALHLIDRLDPSGYFKENTKDVADKLGCEHDVLCEVLTRLKQCDPTGIFASDLSECLGLQLKEMDRFDPAMEMLLKHLDLVASGEFSKLKKLCGVSKEDVMEMCQELRTLNPKPGADFVDELVETAHADIFLSKDENNEWRLELNNERLPKILVNNHYYSAVKQQAKTEDEKAFVSEQYQTANWLLKTLNQRAETILKVSTEIVRQQQEFFEKGIYYLKPMILSDIAQKLEIHESTVGRVTTNKYIATPRGLFELKYFFSSSVHGIDGDEDVSSVTVKHVIKELTDAEESKKILSDDKIVALLKDRGMTVARRTVAKYREALGIPSSVERRRLKRLAN